MTAQGPILLVTERSDLTADLVVAALTKRGAAFDRWNCEDFPLSSNLTWSPVESGGTLRHNGQTVPLGAVRSVWYRRTPASDLAWVRPRDVASFIQREIGSYLQGVWENHRSPWMNRPSCVLRAENKLTQLRLANALGLVTPRTIVTNDPAAARSFLSAVPRAVAKSLTGGTLNIQETSWALFTHPVSHDDLASDSSIQLAPCIFQERIEKGSDIRVTLVGADTFAAEIVTLAEDEVDWRAVERRALTYHTHLVPDELIRRCQSMLRELGLTYGCFDFVLTPKAEYTFLELNPSGQWAWIEHELGFRITESIARLLIEANF